MIPLLIISPDKKLVGEYINKLKPGSLFFEILPTTKEFSIDDIKNLIKETKIFNPQTRIYFLESFNLSSIPAQNSFLKLLEEPPSNVQFILSSDNKNNLLPTIVSRTKIIKLKKTSSENNRNSLFVAPHMDNLIKEGSSSKIPFLQFKITDSEAASKILLELVVYFQKRLEFDKKTPLILKRLIQLNMRLNSNNLNPQLTIDQALIFIWKTYSMK